MDKRAKKLEQVRALLAKADSTNFPEEADAFRAKADELMTAYAIEQWQVDQAQSGTDTRPEPEIRYFDFAWWYTSNRSSELWDMFWDVARHCRCVVALRGQGASGNYREMPVIGLPSDLDYFDLLFTHLMLQMGRQLEPKPDPTKSFDENAYRLRAAGLARPRAAKLLYDCDLIPGVRPDTPYDNLTAAKEKSLRAKVRVAGERYAAAHGLDSTTTVKPQVYQRSFAIGFVREIATRLYALRQMQEGPNTGSSVALALRDIRAIAQSKYDELFPPPESTGKRSRSTAVGRSLKMDDGAYYTGREAGKRAELSARPGQRLGNRKEIDK